MSRPDFLPFAAVCMAGCDLATWVIQAERETCPETGAPLFWNNADGWGDAATADRFTYGDKLNLCLPTGGKWVHLERGRA